eukprot:2927693-Alexandrium_andersonii.AAC.1
MQISKKASRSSRPGPTGGGMTRAREGCNCTSRTGKPVSPRSAGARGGSGSAPAGPAPGGVG